MDYLALLTACVASMNKEIQETRDAKAVGSAIPDGYLLLPREPSVEVLEHFTGRGLMCGGSPHPEVKA